MKWRNPIKDAGLTPNLPGDPNWPMAPYGDSSRVVRTMLGNFYSEARVAPENADPSRRLREYIAMRTSPLFVIWGGPGVGKTWFLRHHLDVRPKKRRNYFTGVIDLRDVQVSSVESVVFQQVCPLLDSYFREFFVSTENAFYDYAKEVIASRKGMTAAAVSSSPSAMADVRSIVGAWIKSPASRDYYTTQLLAVEDLAGPRLFIGVDNIDKAQEEAQTWLLEFCAGFLKNEKINLIVPLRPTQSLFRDRCSGLHERPYESMELPPLDMKEMLRMRFDTTADGRDLSGYFVVDKQRGQKFRYPELFELMFGTKEHGTGEFVVTFAGGNAREALSMTHRILRSDQLKGLENIGDGEHAIAALMLMDSAESDTTFPYLINLFDSEEPGLPKGYGLLRFRVLEYFISRPEMHPSHMHFLKYFERLGYSDAGRLRGVLVTFREMDVIQSSRHLTADELRSRPFENMGQLNLTQIGRGYFDYLIHTIWYWVAVKRGSRLPFKAIDREERDGRVREYVTNHALVQWLADQEKEEAARISSWRLSGQPLDEKIVLEDVHLLAPSAIAKRMLDKDERMRHER